MSDTNELNPQNPTRRKFLSTTGTTAAATLIAAYMPMPVHASEDAGPSVTDTRVIEGVVPITLRVNGKERQLRIDPRTTLLDCIRESVLLSGTKKGCDHGQC
ncbi:MAG TPA: twin-arginine translocation signal domain-containing protein, partial [Albitalea sp.]|uniref:twin-arginine translocation signal domain-containing protein n=1 Tax=Piscinibacter sp. TaxID=1903157 RepID=UPI002ECFE9D9